MARRQSRAGRDIATYEHPDKERVDAPPAGLVGQQTDRDADARSCAHGPHLDSRLSWSGKAEHASFEVLTVSLPLAPGENGRPAVKIVDDRGLESFKIVELA